MNRTYMYKGMYGKNYQSPRTMIIFAVTIIFQSLIAQDSDHFSSTLSCFKIAYKHIQTRAQLS